MKISSKLNHEDTVELVKSLQQNFDIFTWSTANILGISSEVITHQLNASSSGHPMKQKKRHLTLEQSRAMHEEVIKLIEADLIRKVYYPK